MFFLSVASAAGFPAGAASLGALEVIETASPQDPLKHGIRPVLPDMRLMPGDQQKRERLRRMRPALMLAVTLTVLATTFLLLQCSRMLQQSQSTQDEAARRQLATGGSGEGDESCGSPDFPSVGRLTGGESLEAAHELMFLVAQTQEREVLSTSITLDASWKNAK
ncbi:hypothetical protein Efla_004759 [Eimeria flavescens]